MDALGGKYLTFHLDTEEYGLPILNIKEIIGIADITEVPGMADYISGVINLRGKIIPVMDLRLRFGMQPKEYDSRTCIIVLDVEDQSIQKQVGIVVDTVTEVLNIESEQIEKPSTYGSGVKEDYLLGIAKVKEKITILVKIDRILEI